MSIAAASVPPTSRPYTILLVDDEAPLRSSLRRLLLPEGYLILEAGDGRVAMQLIARSVGVPPPPGTPPIDKDVPPIDLVVSDLRMPVADGLEVLRYVRGVAPGIEVIVLTAYGAVSDAVTALKLGAANFLEKPFDPPQLLLEIRRAQLVGLDRQPSPETTVTPPPAKPDAPRLLGESPPMRALAATIVRLGAVDSAVTVLGEHGVGKEVVARAIHAASPRAAAPFVSVHCGGVPDDEFELILCGLAYAADGQPRNGAFAQAEGGTLLLDEVGELTPIAQAKLVRIMQQKVYEPVGGGRARRVDFRLIATTSRDLAVAVLQERFRQDLHDRLLVVPLTVPPLRERPNDLPLLLNHFIAEQNARRRTTLQPPDPTALDALLRYGWPGNVRELEHLVERLAVLKGTGPITLVDLPPMLQEAAARGVLRSAFNPGETPVDLNTELARLELQLVRHAITRAAGNKQQAGRLLGIHRTTMVEKIKRLGLEAFVRELDVRRRRADPGGSEAGDDDE